MNKRISPPGACLFCLRRSTYQARTWSWSGFVRPTVWGSLVQTGHAGFLFTKLRNYWTLLTPHCFTCSNQWNNLVTENLKATTSMLWTLAQLLRDHQGTRVHSRRLCMLRVWACALHLTPEGVALTWDPPKGGLRVHVRIGLQTQGDMEGPEESSA